MDSRTAAVGSATVLVCVALGAAAGAHAGSVAGALAALAGLLPSALLTAATERRARYAAAVRQREDLLKKYAAPGQGEDLRVVRGGGVAGRPVARYLRPEAGVVAFWPRAELDELLAWCVAEGHVGVRLVTGPGGAGKTRLALRLCEDLSVAGWQPLWVPRGSERVAVGDARALGRPCVLVVDYAETRDGLAELAAAAAAGDGPEVRVVLVARSAGEWWQRLISGASERAGDVLVAVEPLPLGPVRGAASQQEVFAGALAGFAAKLDVAAPDVPLVLDDPAPDLAMSLNSHSNRLAALGRRAEALTAIEEAAEIYRELAQGRPGVFLQRLAGSLGDLADRLAALDRNAEAQEAREEATRIGEGG